MPIRPLSRRTMLKAAGATVTLPLLEAMFPGRMWADESAPGPAAAALGPPRRFVTYYIPHGVCNEDWYPTSTGKDFPLSPTLKQLEPWRDQISVISGLHHPRVPENHVCMGGFLSGANYFKEPGISLDQRLAEVYGMETRIPSLSLGHAAGATTASSSLSWTRDGMGLPHVDNPLLVYNRLFVERDADSKEAAMRRLRNRQSALDGVHEEAKRLQRTLGSEDRDRVDQYFQAVRETEKGLTSAMRFIDSPVPQIDRAVIEGDGIEGRGAIIRALTDLTYHAMATDQSRIAVVVTFHEGNGPLPHIGETEDIHNRLSHHGGDQEMLALKAKVDRYFVAEFSRLLGRLKDQKDPDGVSMLDRTILHLGSGLNNGDPYKDGKFGNGKGSHACKDIPLLVAGGKALGIQHSQHLLHTGNKTPACNLLYTYAKALGLSDERFGDSTGLIDGLLKA